MKMTKLIAILLAMALSVSAFLVSCDSEEENAENNAKPQEQSVEIPTLGLKDIMNLDWTEENASYLSAKKDLSYVGEYVDDFGESDTFFVTFEEIEHENDENLDSDVQTSKSEEILRIYNMNSDTEIKSFTNSSVHTVVMSTKTTNATITEYAIDFISNKYFAVLKLSFNGDPNKISSSVKNSEFFDIPLYSFEDVDYTLTIYDAKGTVVKEISEAELSRRCGRDIENFDVAYAGENYEYNGYAENSIIYDFIDVKTLSTSSAVADYFYVDSKLYKDNGNDAEPTFVKDYGISRKPSLGNVTAAGEYYFERSGGSSYGYILTVYDANFNKVYDYTLPSYAYEGNNAIVCFKNGNMLVQYSLALPDDATEYDFEEAAKKYDLVTLSISKDAVVELTNVNYRIANTTSGDIELDDQKIYAESVDALAFISYIGENKKIDKSYANMSLVSLSADGKIAAKIDLGAKVRSFPTRFDENRFKVTLADGTVALYDETGAKVANLSSTSAISKSLGEYFYSSSKNAIYAINGALIRDFDKDFAKVYELGSTLLIETNAADAIVYSIFANGKIETIDEVPFTNIPEGETTPLVSKALYRDASGYYYIMETEFDKETGKVTKKYSYYNEKMESLGEFEYALTELFTTEDFVMIKYISEVEEEKSEVNGLGETVTTTEIIKTTHYVKFLRTK